MPIHVHRASVYADYGQIKALDETCMTISYSPYVCIPEGFEEGVVPQNRAGVCLYSPAAS